MLLKELRTAVLEANLELVKRGLVLYTFGNASGIDREKGLIVIKPSGVDYDELIPEFMVVTDLHGKIIDGKLKPSSDLDTHTLLHKRRTKVAPHPPTPPPKIPKRPQPPPRPPLLPQTRSQSHLRPIIQASHETD